MPTVDGVAGVQRGIFQRRVIGDEVGHIRVVVNTELFEKVADLIASAEGIKADLQEVLALVEGKRIGDLILGFEWQRTAVSRKFGTPKVKATLQRYCCTACIRPKLTPGEKPVAVDTGSPATGAARFSNSKSRS